MDIQYISAIDAQNAAEKGALLLDVREKIETEDVWIDAYPVLSIPLSSFTELENKIPRNRQIIVCCAIGIASEKAANILTEKGYKDVFVLENGLIAWQLAKLPLKSNQDISCQCQCKNICNNKEQ
jgi:rhodanese-related sulfurtransferase